MAKHRSRSNRNQPLSEKSLTLQLPMPVLGVLTDTRQAFHELCILPISRSVNGHRCSVTRR